MPLRLRAERTLHSAGDRERRFAALETGAPLASYADTLNHRFAGKQESG